MRRYKDIEVIKLGEEKEQKEEFDLPPIEPDEEEDDALIEDSELEEIEELDVQQLTLDDIK